MSVAASAPLRLRPLEIGDLLDETFRMYRRHFLLFAGISAILSIPSAALSGYAYGLLNGLLRQAALGVPPDLGFLGPTLITFGAGSLVSLALVPFTYGAVTYAACESAQGRPVTVETVLRGIFHRYFQLLGFWLLVVVMFVVTLMLCVVPVVFSIWVFIGWIAVTPIMFVENTGLGAAMGRSWQLVEGRWWRTFLILFLMVVVYLFARVALGAFVALGQLLLSIVLSQSIVLGISAATAQILHALVNPILQIALVLIYFDLRVRREALDLFQLAQRVSAPRTAS